MSSVDHVADLLRVVGQFIDSQQLHFEMATQRLGELARVQKNNRERLERLEARIHELIRKDRDGRTAA